MICTEAHKCHLMIEEIRKNTSCACTFLCYLRPLVFYLAPVCLLLHANLGGIHMHANLKTLGKFYMHVATTWAKFFMQYDTFQ